MCALSGKARRTQGTRGGVCRGRAGQWYQQYIALRKRYLTRRGGSSLEIYLRKLNTAVTSYRKPASVRHEGYISFRTNNDQHKEQPITASVVPSPVPFAAELSATNQMVAHRAIVEIRDKRIDPHASQKKTNLATATKCGITGNQKEQALQGKTQTRNYNDGERKRREKLTDRRRNR